ncbi:MAG TPA: thiamine pyrophosphate-requiring protein [Gemmatimonadales bacterium]|nr:thiamine pyrophosphate-requiring protein [Gemmatimonadales bacterium]
MNGTPTVGDFLVSRLAAWGVRRIFGYPGDGINGILAALERSDHGIAFVQVRHEEMAALMACAHAKFTGELGVCLATSGPGAIHLLNGLYDASLDHQPVLALVGQSARLSMGSSYQQEVDLHTLFKDVAHEYLQDLVDPAQARHLVDRAVRIALAERTVTCLIVPKDVQELEAMPSPPREHGSTFSGIGWSPPRVLPRDDDLARAAEVLNGGRRIAMLIGAGALRAAPEVTSVAERLGAGVAKALLGRAALPDELPFVTGSIGILGTRPSWTLMQECDTLLMVGTNFPYAEYLPVEGQARGVQIDIDGRQLSLRYPMEVNLVGDSAETLRALLPLLREQHDRSWRERLEREIRDWWAEVGRRALEPADPLNPQRVVWELSSRLPDDCIVTGDSGTSAAWLARDLRLRAGMMASLSGGLATMGSAVPYAVAAKFAHPGRTVVAIAGDGAMQMNGNNGLITIAKYWWQWDDPRLVVLVLNNRDLNFVTWEQRMVEGMPKYAATQDIPDFPYARYAELLGLRGIRVSDPEQVGRAWDEALSSDRPVVLEAYVDKNVPVLPPHLKPEQLAKLAEALQAGDPDAAGVRRQTSREDPDALRQQ